MIKNRKKKRNRPQLFDQLVLKRIIQAEQQVNRGFNWMGL